MSYTKRLFLSLALMAAAIAAVALTRAPAQASGTSSLVARYLPRYASAPNCVRTFQLYGDTGTGKVRFCSVVGTPGTWNDLVAGSSAGISSLNGLTGTTQTFANDTNVTISSSGTAHTVGWSGSLAVSRGGTGTGSALTQGSIVFAGGSGVYSQDNAKLFWDDSSDALGIGTTTPGVVNGTNFASVVKLHLKPGAASSYIVNDSTTAGGLLINLSDSSADNRLWAVYASRAGTERLAFAAFSDAGSPNEYWFIKRGDGHFLAGTDNAHDIGASGATRPRSIYAGTSVVTPVLSIPSGGSTSISSGTGTVKMTSANNANNAVWIPITYNGTVYYVPGWTAHAP